VPFGYSDKEVRAFGYLSALPQNIMGFTTAKILISLILPPASLLILMTAGVFIMKFNRILSRLLIVSGLLLLYLLSINPVSDFLLKPLERSTPPVNERREKADAIVVLGGGVRDLSWLELKPQPSAMSLERLVAGVRLYKELHIPLVIIGGNGNPFQQEIKEADAMGRVAVALGVPVKDIIVENAPRNTLESARASKNLIKGNRIILVTSAYHMKRASAMFKKQGFDVAQAPAGYRSEQRGLSLNSCIPRAGSLCDSSDALAEYLGLFWYAVTGAM
jgi:uncharacterized SAM-binding protein YcdF (DUF218 family)